MSKLMLVSAFAPVSHLLERIEPNLKGKTVTFIPTASMKDSTGFFNRMAKWKLRALGLNVQEIDVAVASYHDIKTTIASSSMIYVTGGNTFYLLQSLRYSSSDELIAQAVREGKTYIGESAGAVVAGPNIEYIKRMDSEDPAPLPRQQLRGPGTRGLQHRAPHRRPSPRRIRGRNHAPQQQRRPHGAHPRRSGRTRQRPTRRTRRTLKARRAATLGKQGYRLYSV